MISKLFPVNSENSFPDVTHSEEVQLCSGCFQSITSELVPYQQAMSLLPNGYRIIWNCASLSLTRNASMNPDKATHLPVDLA